LPKINGLQQISNNNSLQNRPAFKALSSNGQNCLTDISGGWNISNAEIIEYETEQYDNFNLYDTANGRFTVTDETKGFYRCCARILSVAQDIETAGDDARIGIFKNGASAPYITLDYQEADDPNGAKEWGLNGCDLVELSTTGDYIQIGAGHDDATTACISSEQYNSFSCVKEF
jgi:hypothetical protein